MAKKKAAAAKPKPRTSDASNRELLQAVDERAKWLEGQINIGLNDCLKTAQGRAFIWWLLEGGHIFETISVANPLHPMVLGERNGMLRLLDRVMTLRPESFIEMMKENQERQMVTDQIKANAVQTGDDDAAE